MQPIKTTKGEILAVQVSEGASVISLNVPMDILSYSINGIPNLIDLPSNNWQLIAPLSEVTEEQAKMMVEAKHNLKYADRNDLTGYRSYGKLHTDGKPYWLATALDSFKSLMQANGVTGNPIILFKPKES